MPTRHTSITDSAILLDLKKSKRSQRRGDLRTRCLALNDQKRLLRDNWSDLDLAAKKRDLLAVFLIARCLLRSSRSSLRTLRSCYPQPSCYTPASAAHTSDYRTEISTLINAWQVGGFSRGLEARTTGMKVKIGAKRSATGTRDGSGSPKCRYQLILSRQKGRRTAQGEES